MLKRMLRKSSLPLQQITKRLQETENAQMTSSIKPNMGVTGPINKDVEDEIRNMRPGIFYKRFMQYPVVGFPEEIDEDGTTSMVVISSTW
ncbi:hypothetical protein ILUMI_18814, partial [Ignelater luminosus]